MTKKYRIVTFVRKETGDDFGGYETYQTIRLTNRKNLFNMLQQLTCFKQEFNGKMLYQDACQFLNYSDEIIVYLYFHYYLH